VINVYLCGGTHSGWQEDVKRACPDFEYIDPTKKNMSNPQDYTAWDLFGIQKCDILFANMESSNPGGWNAAIEIGYAKALGKTIILVDDKSLTDEKFMRYFAMGRVMADHLRNNLEDGVGVLMKYSVLN